jgi:hypothetical protein
VVVVEQAPFIMLEQDIKVEAVVLDFILEVVVEVGIVL